MPLYICATCGTQYSESAEPPAACMICEDERQYIGPNGQQWTTLEAVQAGHRAVIQEEEPGLTGIGAEPRFAIGQRALLIERPEGNILWECMTLINDEIVREINRRGGLKAIAISHPHYYSTMVEWSHAFGGVPVYLHEADRKWVARPDPALVFWSGDTLALADDVILIHCGGHFPGSSVLHWSRGAEGRGVLLTGDTINVVQDRRWVSFMYSYPNQIPLPAWAVRRIVSAVEPFAFDRVYSAWFGTVVARDAKAAVERSAARYISAISAPPPVG